MKKNESKKSLIQQLGIYSKGVNLPDVFVHEENPPIDIINLSAIDPSGKYAVTFTQEWATHKDALHLQIINKQPEKCSAKPLRQPIPHRKCISPTDKILKFLNPHIFVLIHKLSNKIDYYETSTLKLKKLVSLDPRGFTITDMIKLDDNLHSVLRVNRKLGKSEVIFMNDQGTCLRRLRLNTPFTCATMVTYQGQDNCLFLLSRDGNYAIISKENYRQHLLAQGTIPLDHKHSRYEWKTIKTISMNNTLSNECSEGQWIAGVITPPIDLRFGLKLDLEKKIIFYHVDLNKSLIIKNDADLAKGLHISEAHFLQAVTKTLNKVRSLAASPVLRATNTAHTKEADEEALTQHASCKM